LPAHHAMADVFAMPCRTRGSGLDVEGLGIVYLEASSTGVPVVAGRSGGAPETVVDGETGVVVDGWDVG
ncbi:alpha-(1-2)-phosphatidylinositol mannosyltransferase, partial [Mycobacterium sp. ITM-2017-0098]